MEISGLIKIALYLVAAIAFVPSALFTSEKIPSRMQPRVHRPIAFFLGGVFLFVIGLGCIYLAFSAVHAGTVPCAMRSCSSSYSLDQPFPYWIFVAMWYGIGVVISGAAIAAVRKACSQP